MLSQPAKILSSSRQVRILLKFSVYNILMNTVISTINQQDHVFFVFRNIASNIPYSRKNYIPCPRQLLYEISSHCLLFGYNSIKLLLVLNVKYYTLLEKDRKHILLSQRERLNA